MPLSSQFLRESMVFSPYNFEHTLFDTQNKNQSFTLVPFLRYADEKGLEKKRYTSNCHYTDFLWACYICPKTLHLHTPDKQQMLLFIDDKGFTLALDDKLPQRLRVNFDDVAFLYEPYYPTYFTKDPTLPYEFNTPASITVSKIMSGHANYFANTSTPTQFIQSINTIQPPQANFNKVIADTKRNNGILDDQLSVIRPVAPKDFNTTVASFVVGDKDKIDSMIALYNAQQEQANVRKEKEKAQKLAMQKQNESTDTNKEKENPSQ